MISRRALLSASVLAAARASVLNRPDDIVGRPAPPLKLDHWLNSSPLEMSDLRGKVVLLRWWTEGCPYCEATGPALRALQRKYESQGLRIIGVYHPKPAGDWDMAKVKTAVEEKHFTFPIAVDGDWKALRRWWLTRDRDFTSVSFLVDRRGIVRYIQTGGEFHEGNEGGFPNHESCHRDYRAIEDGVRRL